MTHAVKSVQLLDLGLLHRTVTVSDGDLLTVFQCATVYATYGDTTGIRAVVERCNQHLWGALQLCGSRDNLQNLVQQIGDICGGLVIVLTHPTVLGRAIDYGEVQLVFSSAQ